MKFAVGQPVRRSEDQILITGAGRYTDDITLPNMTQAVVVRAQAAHANIRKLDASAAKAMPGVLLVLTGDDVKADGLGDVPCHAPLNNKDGSPRHDTPRPAPVIRIWSSERRTGWPTANFMMTPLNNVCGPLPPRVTPSDKMGFGIVYR